VPAGVDAALPTDTRWHPVDRLPELAFDHKPIVLAGRDRLRAKLSYTNIGFALAPAVFTIAQLRDVYTATLGYRVSATNLQRILTRRAVIEPTSALSRPSATGGRPAVLYQFASRTLVVTNPFAAFRPSAHVRELAGPRRGKRHRTGASKKEQDPTAQAYWVLPARSCVPEPSVAIPVAF
jgi:hypothetical protein